MIRVFFDTNVLAYMFDASSPDKQRLAQEAFQREASQGLAVISAQVLQELFVTVTRKFDDPLGIDDAERVVRDLTRLPVVPVEPRLILLSIERLKHSSISFWDALIIESALAGGCSTLLTEDLQHGQKINGLLVSNPFASPAS